MAGSALNSSIGLLGKILVEEGKYLYGAQEKVEEMQEELRWMEDFLRRADAARCQDEIYTLCIQRYASAAEDIIYKFYIKLVYRRRQQNSLLYKLRRYSCIFKELYDLHQVASAIDALKVEISALSTRIERYGLMKSFHSNIAAAPRNERRKNIQRRALLEKRIIGFEENAKEIITVLTSSPPGKGFHAIYGMGGSGKTTLATEVLEDDVIKQRFFGGQAFVYISKQFKVEIVLQEILKGLTSWSPEGKDRLVPKLHEVPKQKKCLIVLDDVWTKEAWDSLKSTFTPCGGDSGSKVLLTTRKEDVAKHVDVRALQKPDLLKDPKDWELLKETMEWHPEDISTQKQRTTKIIGRNDGMFHLNFDINLIKHVTYIIYYMS